MMNEFEYGRSYFRFIYINILCVVHHHRLKILSQNVMDFFVVVTENGCV